MVAIETFVGIPVIALPDIIQRIAITDDADCPEIAAESVADGNVAAFDAVEIDAGDVVGDQVVDENDAVNRIGRRVGHDAVGAMDDFVADDQRCGDFLERDAGTGGVHGVGDTVAADDQTI